MLSLELSDFSSTYPRIIYVVGIFVLLIVVTRFVKRLVQFHDRYCGPCIAIGCLINSCFYYTCPCVFTCHSQVTFLYYLANLWQPFSVLYFQGYCSHKTHNTHNMCNCGSHFQGYCSHKTHNTHNMCNCRSHISRRHKALEQNNW